MLYRLLLIILLYNIPLIYGDDYGNISTSRPGSSNPTSSVPQGLFQLELGINSNLNNNISYPILTRVGVLSSTEIQIGYGDNLSIGLLCGGINIIDNFENSIIINATLSENNDEVLQTDIFFSFSVSNSLPVWGQIASSIPNLKDEDISIHYAIALGNGIGDNMSWFGELYGSNNSTSIDAGITYLISNQIQIDISTGTSLDNTKSKFVEFGFSYRFPK